MNNHLVMFYSVRDLQESNAFTSVGTGEPMIFDAACIYAHLWVDGSTYHS